MKKKTVKKFEKKVEPKAKKIAVRHTHDVIKEAQSEPPEVDSGTVTEPPVNLAESLPTHTPGLERC